MKKGKRETIQIVPFYHTYIVIAYNAPFSHDNEGLKVKGHLSRDKLPKYLDKRNVHFLLEKYVTVSLPFGMIRYQLNQLLFLPIFKKQ